MATTIITKYGSGAPAASDVVRGELAVDTENKRLYTEDSGGSVVELGTNPAANVTFGDNVKAVFGAGSDLQIYHDGSHSYIKDAGTGDLYIQGEANVRITDGDGNKMFLGQNDGEVQLYYNGIEKFHTQSTGVNVIGTVTADDLIKVTTAGSTAAEVDIVSGATWRLRSNPISGTNNYGLDIIKGSAGTDVKMSIDSSGNVGIGTTSPNSELTVIGNVRAGSNVTPTSTIQNSTVLKSMQIFSTAGQSVNRGGAIELGGFYDNGVTTTTVFGAVAGLKEADATGVESGYLSFQTNSSGTISEAMRIGSSGNVGIGTSSVDTKLHLEESDTTSVFLKTQNSAGALLVGNNSAGNSFVSSQTSGKDLLLETNNTERMRISSTGAVNIGGTTMDEKLNIQTGSTGEKAMIAFRNTQAGTQIGMPANVNALTFTTADTERMRIDSSGNVLVGLTSTSGIATGSTADNGIYLDGANGAVVAQSSANKNLYVSKATGFTDPDFISFQVAGSEVGAIGTNSGYLVIGSSNNSADAYLLMGNNLIHPASSSGGGRDATIDLGGSGARFKNLYLSGVAYNGDGSASAPSISFGADTNTGFYRVGSDQIGFVTAGSLKAKLDASGNLLVGTTSQITTGGFNPLFNVSSSNNAAFLKCTGGGAIQGMQSGGTTGAQNFLLFYNQGGTNIGSIQTSNGNTGTTVSYNTSSDERLKDNIVDAPSASDDIDAIQVRSFDWKVDGSHQKYGMVAQELVTVAPEAVTQPEDPEEMMGVDYSKLVPMMLKEIQQLRARVAQLEGEN